jgi:hypothetical protein
MLKQFIADHAWTWPLLVYLATGVLNFIIWFHDSEEWDRFALTHPEWAAAIRLLRAYGMHVRKQIKP